MRALRVLQQRSNAIRERVRAAVASEGDAIAAAKRAHHELDVEHARAIARDPASAPACSAGCSHCCHVHVEATRAEVLAIADRLREKGEGFVERLAAQVEIVAALDHEERWRARIACALLGDDGRCTVYEVRPLRCRAFHSCSADVCREAFAGGEEPSPETNLALARACDAAEEGFEQALAEHGMSSEPVLLEVALLEALADR
jgi:Fe-S-cluster containining protein